MVLGNIEIPLCFDFRREMAAGVVSDRYTFFDARWAHQIPICFLRIRLHSVMAGGQIAVAAASEFEGIAGQPLLKHESAMWTFVRFIGIESTHNHTECVLRHVGLWGTFGSERPIPTGENHANSWIYRSL